MIKAPDLDTGSPADLGRLEHIAIAAGTAESVRLGLRDIAKHADAAGETVAAHKARAAIQLVDELREDLTEQAGSL